ncbi:universal stress family protein [Candidatus Nitrosopumilus salaria BD31]|uniref:Universal stress family protein n=1 Tax=Candidatus Nitrosopumilus salarius BD31 TaxID=859350 RepID=I3D3P1_9ARCH|nr:universal stress protein [Candidatus Nitrosopumilus salaria]EIJ66334.1 universal stress family protein [Candidatus Nitrosopumilus salaria BD31]
MTVSHILVPYDGSEPSDRAFDEALKIAKKYDSKLLTLTCFHGIVIYPFGFKDYSLNEKELPDKFQKLKEKAFAENVSYVHHSIQSPAIVSTIQSFALENNVDMIIMGSQNRQGLNKELNGDISDEVNRHAHCIVKVVK